MFIVKPIKSTEGTEDEVRSTRVCSRHKYLCQLGKTKDFKRTYDKNQWSNADGIYEGHFS